MARYDQPEAGEWVQPTPEGYKFQCCDCGLVHRLDFRIVYANTGMPVRFSGRKVQFRAFRDERATAAVRRERRKRDEKA